MNPDELNFDERDEFTDDEIRKLLNHAMFNILKNHIKKIDSMIDKGEILFDKDNFELIEKNGTLYYKEK
ncbi:hypothetical protein LCGC14_1425410 [marine sediment metagenome]|uniref:Uncharacterized protein n=1 Tax=marine sediment metagenome TaxID=412755 RepID=A0A0F9M5M5_9ZZZZ